MVGRIVSGVPTFDVVTRDHVLSALSEYDERGAEEFLARYGFGPAREYLLLHGGRSYDSKAVLGVAHKYATGRAATSSEFSGGVSGAAKVLRQLGFEVTSLVEDGGGMQASEGRTWREVSEVGSEQARSAWADAGREVLLATAHRYRDVVTYKLLSEQVQARTGIRTKQLMHYWIGDVLGRVSADCSRRGEPLLSSLCINSEGSVGPGYAVAVEAASGRPPADLDEHAARERLACYRYFDAVGLPPDGGSPALTHRLAAARERTRKAKAAERPTATCPTCHTQLPVTGVCDYCS
ncbi:hypothetical protein EV644_11595 [Kribbella orskensis]|uniref:ScoMcrA-like N-terminal head domain-containing protein n=1 Tax=Kribbella orskensis TaxID=2512216 RepID=A0ABY2BDE2_9ACTN|nr:hypothetical protein EV642_11695 [Kribbella sp. VKM Ac-2500]TCO17074.1 hypothetical protein EV644_11595 [Kribbella orskensis]